MKNLFLTLICTTAAALNAAPAPEVPTRLNILFITTEDLSPHFGVYGEKAAVTPAIDRFAGRALRYDRMFGIAAVCAPNRSSIITGMYPQSLGSQHMRCHITIPPDISLFPALLRQAGYFTSNNHKEDYNFGCPKGVWDENGNSAHWRNRPAGKPFYSVFNFMDTHEGAVALESGAWSRNIKKLKPEQLTDPARVEVPPYYPDTPEVRKILARQLDNVQLLDRFVNRLLQELETDGLAGETIVAIMSDHGDGYLRMKRSLFDSGMRVPLLVHVPENFRQPGQAEPGGATDELVSMVDLAATFLNLAGVVVPEWNQGHPFLGNDRAEPRRFIYGGRDRMDERVTLQRTIRDGRFRYIRTFTPHVTEFLDINAPARGNLWKHFLDLEKQGALPEVTRRYLREPVPFEQLFDTVADPHEIHNLASDPAHAKTREALASELKRWQLDIVDSGMIPEGILLEIQKSQPIYTALRTPEFSAWVPKALEAAQIASNPESAPDAILLLTLSDCPPVRFWGTYGIELRKIDTPSSRETLVKLLGDPHPDIRSQAAAALLALGRTDEPVLDVLRANLLASDNPGVQILAGNITERQAAHMRPLLPVIRQAATFKAPGYGRALNVLMNRSLAVLGEPPAGEE